MLTAFLGVSTTEERPIKPPTSFASVIAFTVDDEYALLKSRLVASPTSPPTCDCPVTEPDEYTLLTVLCPVPKEAPISPPT